MPGPVPISPLASPAHVLVKPAGPDCNLRCGYCFYLEKSALFNKKAACRMPDIVLEHYTRSYIASQPFREVEFAWQGGEPTLLGVDFFRRAVALQKKYGEGRVINNAIQTNGTLLDDEWCAFLAQEKFLVGLSVDGPKQIHDRYRTDAAGNGSFDKVMKGLACMKKHGVEFNALTCITRESAEEGLQIYRFLRENGFQFMQFIPIVERHPDAADAQIGLSLGGPPETVSGDHQPEMMPFSVQPEGYGTFLIDIFDEWVRHDVGKIFVNHFDVALAAWTGANPPLCVNSRICGSALAVEHDGAVYACDHFVYPSHLRGNVMTDDLVQLIRDRRQQAFGMQKQEGLTQDCKQCRYLRACHGGCLKHRINRTDSGETGHNYLCAGYRRFYEHVAPYMEQMAALLQQQRPAADIMKSFGSAKKQKSKRPRK